jgi:general secretion pathway protein G
MRTSNQSSRGFTLVELVVVVMILGVLGAVATARLLGTSEQSVDSSLRHTLAVIREAVDRYAAEHGGELPGADGQESTFKTDLAKFLRGSEFPKCPVGAARFNDVFMAPATTALSEADVQSTEGTHSWLYKYETGDFYINSSELSSDNETKYYEF